MSSMVPDHCMKIAPEDDYIDTFVTLNITNSSQCNCEDEAYWYQPICNCDYPIDALAAPPVESIPIGTLYALVFLVGTVGNVLVIVVVSRFKRMRNVTNVFLASLSTADLLLIWFNVPIMYFKYISFTWTLGAFLCYSLHYIQEFAMCCSVLTLTAISIERYMAIAYPMRTMLMSSIGRSKKVIAVIWFMSAVLALPTGFRLDYTSYYIRDNTVEIGRCFKEFPKIVGQDNFWQERLERAYVVYHTILRLVIPLCTMTVCYSRVACIVYSSSCDNGLSTSVPMVNLRNRKERRKYMQEIFAEMHKNYTAVARLAQKTPTKDYNSINANGETVNGETEESVADTSVKRKPPRVSDSSKKQIVNMLIAIVILFTICWTPTIVNELLVGFDIICGPSTTSLAKHLRMGIHVAAYIQSCINPCVYAFISQNFRATFLTVFRRLRAGQGPHGAYTETAPHRQYHKYSNTACHTTRGGLAVSPSERHRRPTNASLATHLSRLRVGGGGGSEKMTEECRQRSVSSVVSQVAGGGGGGSLKITTECRQRSVSAAAVAVIVDEPTTVTAPEESVSVVIGNNNATGGDVNRFLTVPQALGNTACHSPQSDAITSLESDTAQDATEVNETPPPQTAHSNVLFV